MLGSKGLAPSDLETFDDVRLYALLESSKEELFNLRFQSATGQLSNHSRMRAVRRDIARVATIIRERELGIRAQKEPAPEPEASDTKNSAEKKPAAENSDAENKEKA